MTRTFLNFFAFFFVKAHPFPPNEAFRAPFAVLIALIWSFAGADSAGAQQNDSPPEANPPSEAAPEPEESVSPPAPFPDFTFKKIAPPAPGTNRRITVQIVPQADPPAALPPAPTEDALPIAPEPQEVSGFWRALGTGRSDRGPGRLLDAMAWFETADPAPAAPPLRDLASLADTYGRDMLTVSIGTRVSPALALAVAWTESSGDVSVVSPKGAQGLMQLIPATAERFEVKDPFNAQENLRGGVTYLDWLLERFDGDPLLALAGYNAGERAVDRANDGAGGVPDYPETREYVVKVLSAWRVARGLCRTPPELASDGCVFLPIAEN